MLSKVTVLCFAASYGVALALELTRLLFRSGVRGAVMLGFTAAGLVAHTAFLFYQGVRFNEQLHGIGSPLSSTQHWYLTAAWVLAVVYLLLTFSYPKVQFGLFFLPLVLGLIGVAHHFADPEPAARAPDARIWGLIHGGSILLATVSVLVGLAAGLMYLGQARRLKHKLPPQRGLRLPSLEWLQETNRRSLVVAMATLAVGIVSGMILNVIHHDRDKGFVPWTDPVIVVTVGLFGWLLLSSVLGLVYQPAREGRKVAYFTVVSFAFLVAALAVGLFMDTQHGGQRQNRAWRGDRPRPAATPADSQPGATRPGPSVPGGAS
ncbi:MAG: cytochrome c biogenesis protein CcsA [Thermoguttaceae bacterium]|jgi:ABC-type uncharacterized transport system permease subunit|nr:cytochrome c biogenesis protein CcsA [Thermoguttaceae bacterium]